MVRARGRATEGAEEDKTKKGKRGKKDIVRKSTSASLTILPKRSTAKGAEKNSAVAKVRPVNKDASARKTVTSTNTTRKVTTYASRSKVKVQATLKTQRKTVVTRKRSRSRSVKDVIVGRPKTVVSVKKQKGDVKKGVHVARVRRTASTKKATVNVIKRQRQTTTRTKTPSKETTSKRSRQDVKADEQAGPSAGRAAGETSKEKAKAKVKKDYMTAGFYCHDPHPSVSHQLVNKVLKARTAEEKASKASRRSSTASTKGPSRATRGQQPSSSTKGKVVPVLIDRPTLPPLPYDHGYNLFFGQQYDFDLPWNIKHEYESGLLARKRKPTPFQKLRANVYPERARVLGDYKAICKCTPESRCGDNCINRIMSYLCGRDCPAGENCENKTLTKRKSPGYKIVDTGARGFGVVLTEDVEEGAFVIDYRGEVISMDMFMDRIEDEYKGRKNFYALAYDEDEVIDGGMRGNDARFINHGCAPNLEVRKYQTLGDGWNEFEVGMWALRDIKAGEELFYDYNFESFGVAAQSDELRTKCCCGAPNCVGFLGRKTGEKSAKELAAEMAKAKLGKKAKKTRSKMNKGPVRPLSIAVLALEGTPSVTDGSTAEPSLELGTPSLKSPTLSEVAVMPRGHTASPELSSSKKRKRRNDADADADADGAKVKPTGMKKGRKSKPIPTTLVSASAKKVKEERVKARNGAPKGWVYLVPGTSAELMSGAKPVSSRRPPRDRSSLG